MNRALLILPVLAPALALAACQRSDDKGATVTFNSGDGTVRAAVGGEGDSGGIKVDLPGFKGEVKLPKVNIDADDFELNGVHLYPGSSIETIDVRGDQDGRGDQGGVKIRFNSPADPNTVRDWFLGRLQKAGFTLRPDGASLVGTDDENKPFRMDLSPDGEGAKGTIAIGG